MNWKITEIMETNFAYLFEIRDNNQVDVWRNNIMIVKGILAKDVKKHLLPSNFVLQRFY